VVDTDGGGPDRQQGGGAEHHRRQRGTDGDLAATASVAENMPASTVVYTATATDPDTSAPFNTKAWSLTGNRCIAAEH